MHCVFFFWILEREAQINKLEISKIIAGAVKARKELDIAEFGAGKLGGVVTKLQRRQDRLEDLERDGRDQPPSLESGSHDLDPIQAVRGPHRGLSQ